MADTAASRSRARGDASFGDLISLAVQDASRLVRAEMDLAKVELREDGKRLGIAGLLIGMAAFAGCLVLMLLCFALAYGLNTLGVPLWASFLIVAGICVLLAALATGTCTGWTARQYVGARLVTRPGVPGDGAPAGGAVR